MPRLGEVTFYPRALDKNSMLEILTAGFTLQAIAAGKVRVHRACAQAPEEGTDACVHCYCCMYVVTWPVCVHSGCGSGTQRAAASR